MHRHVQWGAPGRAVAAGFAVVLLLAAAGPARAECPRVLRGIERVRVELREARGDLRDCPAESVGGLLDQAAKQLDQGGRRAGDNDCSRAANHLEAARRLLLKARDLCRDADHGQGRVLDFLRRTDADLRDAAAAAAGDPECRRLLRAAEERQSRAWNQFRSGKLRFSLSLSAGARRAAERAALCGRGDAGAVGAVIPELEETDTVLAALRDGTTRTALARRLQALAWRQVRERDRPVWALRLTETARHLARAGTLDRGGSDTGGGIGRTIGAVSRLLDDLEPPARSDAEARDLLGRSRQLLDQSRRLLRAGDRPGATAKLEASTGLAAVAAERLDRLP